jgi:hypothetical protein
MNTDEKARSALTAKEWQGGTPSYPTNPGIIHKLGDEDKGREHVELWDWGVHITAEGSEGVNLFNEDRDRHAVAALCLYGQPFGFTRQHLADIDWVLDKVGGTGDYLRDVREVLMPIRTLIEALLPPK